MHGHHKVEEKLEEANPGDEGGLALGGQEADDVRRTEEAMHDGHADEGGSDNLWDAPAREAAQSMPLGVGEETVAFQDDGIAADGAQQQQWLPPGELEGQGGMGSVMSSGARNLARSGEAWARAAPVARQKKPSPTALAVYSWGMESRKGGVREAFTATIEQAEMAKVWSNGDVAINSGGKGMTPAAKVILSIFLRVFKAEIAEVEGNEGDKGGGGWQIEHQTGYKQAFSENMSMSLFANRDWPYIKTKLKRLPTKIFLPKEPNTVRPSALPPAEQRKQGLWSAAHSGGGRRIARKERVRERRGHDGAQSRLPQLGQPGGTGNGNGNPSATAFADAAVKKGVPPEIVQQLLKAAGGNAGTIAALAAAAVAAAAGGRERDPAAVAEGLISETEGASRGTERHRMGRRVSPGEAGTSSDGYDVNRVNGHGVENVNANAYINPPVLSASSVSHERGPAPVAVVSEAVVSSPPYGSESGLATAGGANERSELDGSSGYYNNGERRRRRERSWSRSRGSHRGDGDGEADVDTDTRGGHRKRPTRSPEGWRPWRPEDDSPTSPRRSRAEETDGGSWREHGRRRRRVDEGRRRTGFDGGGAWGGGGGRGGRGNSGAGGGFNGYRSGHFGGMGRGEGLRRDGGFGRNGDFRTDDGFGWDNGFGRGGGFGRGAGFGRGDGFGRGGGFGRGDGFGGGGGNGGRSWRSQSPPPRRTGSSAWSPSRNKNEGYRDRARASRWGGREHGGNLKPPSQTSDNWTATEARGNDATSGGTRSEKQFVIESHERESLRAGESGNSVERAEDIDRRDSYDPEQYDPDAYDPGEVTVKRDADGDGRKQRSSRSGSLTRTEGRRRRSDRSRSRSRSGGPSGKRNRSSMVNLGTEEDREVGGAKERFDDSSSLGTVNLSAQSSTQPQLSVKGDRGFDVGGSGKGDGNVGTPWVNATSAASFTPQQQQQPPAPLGWQGQPHWQQQLQAHQPAPSQPQQLPLYSLPPGPPQQLPLPQQHQQQPLVQHPQVQLHITQQPQQLHTSMQQQQQQPTVLAVHNSGGVWLGVSQSGTRPG